MAVLNLGPNDVLVVSVPGPISRETAQQLETSIRKNVPDANKIMVLANGITLGVLHQGEV